MQLQPCSKRKFDSLIKIRRFKIKINFSFIFYLNLNCSINWMFKFSLITKLHVILTAYTNHDSKCGVKIERKQSQIIKTGLCLRNSIAFVHTSG
jgi:hypothetical protein